MPSAPQHVPWTSTYRLSSATRQQRIRSAILRLDHPGITAVGSTGDAGPMIVIECASAAAEIRSRQIVLAVDPQAVRIETARAAAMGRDGASAEAAYRTGLERLRRLL